MTAAYFTERDRKTIESLPYDPTLEPSFELTKSCLFWPDEQAEGLTPTGCERLCDLWIARTFIHRGLPFSSRDLDPLYFEHAWTEALADNIAWPGFKQLEILADTIDPAVVTELGANLGEAGFSDITVETLPGSSDTVIRATKQ